MKKVALLAAHAGLALLLMSGCAKRPATAAAAAPAPTGRAVAGAGNGGATEQAAVHPSTAASPSASSTTSSNGATTMAAARPPMKDFAENAALKDIHFDFDKYEIRPGDARLLEENAHWMKTNPGNLMLIEGHADERGTNEYNLALGERRAKATMNYLVSQGVQSSRLTTVSYGEERPLCPAHTEACWAKNRRAHFLVKQQ